MFEFFDDITIDDAVKFQQETYFSVDENNNTVLNIAKMEEARADVLKDLTGGSKEQYNNFLLLDKVPVLKYKDGFIYTTKDGESICCTGCIADEDNIIFTRDACDLVCIADEIETDAFAIKDFGEPLTLFSSLYLPFVKSGKLPEHSLLSQIGNIYCNNVSQQEIKDAIGFVDISKKVLLTVSEAHELFNLSEKSLYDFARENPNSHVLLKKGKKLWFKRSYFEEFILGQAEWNYGN